jgi:hypothetical protein
MGWKGGIVVAAFASVATTGSVSFAAPEADTGQASIQERLKRVGADLFSGADRVNESIRELKATLRSILARPRRISFWELRTERWVLRS